MQLELVVVWLLVSAIIFVFFAAPFDQASPRQPTWLLVFAASWPLLIPYMVIGAIVTLLCLPMLPHRKE